MVYNPYLLEEELKLPGTPISKQIVVQQQKRWCGYNAVLDPFDRLNKNATRYTRTPYSYNNHFVAQKNENAQLPRDEAKLHVDVLSPLNVLH